MEQQLLEHAPHEPAAPVRQFFNTAYAQGKFLWAVGHIGERRSCGVEEQFCFFPDTGHRDPIHHFSGVAFDSLAGDVVVSEAECLAEMRRACGRYVERHPEDLGRVEQLLAATRLAR